jgi:hypothetical protein
MPTGAPAGRTYKCRDCGVTTKDIYLFNEKGAKFGPEPRCRACHEQRIRRGLREKSLARTDQAVEQLG